MYVVRKRSRAAYPPRSGLTGGLNSYGRADCQVIVKWPPYSCVSWCCILYRSSKEIATVGHSETGQPTHCAPLSVQRERTPADGPMGCTVVGPALGVSIGLGGLVLVLSSPHSFDLTVSRYP